MATQTFAKASEWRSTKKQWYEPGALSISPSTRCLESRLRRAKGPAKRLFMDTVVRDRPLRPRRLAAAA